MQYSQGRWYEIGRYDQNAREQGADCVIFEYVTEGLETFCLLKEIIDKKLVTTKWSAKLAPGANGYAKVIYSYVKNRKSTTYTFCLAWCV